MTRLSVVLIAVAWTHPAAAESLSFEQAVNNAEPAAESMLVARAGVERSEAVAATAAGAYFPDISGTASYQRTLASQFDDISFGDPTMMGAESDSALPFGQPNSWNLGFRVLQPIFDGFRTPALNRSSKAGLRAARLGVESTRAQVVLAVAQSYYDAVLAQRQVEIAEVTLQQAETTFKETELGFKQGAMPEFDLVRAEVARDNQRTLLVQFKVQADVALVELRRVVGIAPNTPLTLTTGLDADDVEAVAQAARVAAKIQQHSNRVAIAQAHEGVEASQAELDAARAARWPSIAAVSDFGIVNYHRHPFTSGWFTNWTVGVNLTVPIFDQNRNRHQVKLREAELSSARAQLAQAREVSDVEDAQAAAALAASATQLESSKRTVQQATRAYQIAELRFQQGASTHLELVDTRVQLEQALLVQARAARDLRIARIRQGLLPGLPLGATAGRGLAGGQ